jgi:3-methyl-2-oxobutanoate hydroxymethyltransferase
MNVIIGYKNKNQALKSAISMVKKVNVQAIKVEGGIPIIKKIEKIIQAGIPVMGHLGLMPQFIHHYKGYELQAKEEKQAEQLIKEQYN